MKTTNAVVVMESYEAHATNREIMSMANYMQKGTPTSKIFNNESVLSGWYKDWLSQMIAKGILKISSGTVSHDVTREAWCTYSNLEASYSLHASEMVKAGIDEYNTSYDETVERSEESIVTQSSYIILYDEMLFQITQKGTGTNTNVEHTMRAS